MNPFHASVEYDFPEATMTGGSANWESGAAAAQRDFILTIDPEALRFALRDTVEFYVRPTDPVAEDDWEALNDPA